MICGERVLWESVNDKKQKVALNRKRLDDYRLDVLRLKSALESSPTSHAHLEMKQVLFVHHRTRDDNSLSGNGSLAPKH